MVLSNRPNCGGILAISALALLSVVVSENVNFVDPKILSCIAGLHRCIGVDDAKQAEDFGCELYNTTTCSGTTTITPCGACRNPRQMAVACIGQHLTNHTGQDGTPVTFNLPVVVDTVKAEHFLWTFADGTSRSPGCAIPDGQPAGEANELQTIAIVGNAGGWVPDSATGLEIIGDLMLLHPNGTKISAKGLKYFGSALNYSRGPELLTVELEVFSTLGEETSNIPIRGKIFPNHCHVLFPETTHRLRLLFDGGVSLDGKHPITPDRTDLFHVLDAHGAKLPDTSILGLADLGTAPMPESQCEKKTYKTDGDNYLDICLNLANNLEPTYLFLPCTRDTQISAPKGLGYPCVPQNISVIHKT